MELEKFIEDRAKEIVLAQKEKKQLAETPAKIAQKEIVDAKATQMAVGDEALMESLSQAKKKEFIHSANANLKKEEAENKKADIELQEANFGVNSGVADYAGIKKPLPQKMQTILFTILAAFQLLFLIVIGVPISIFNITLDSVDSAVMRLSNVTKSARILVLAILGFSVVVLIAYVIVFYLKKFGIVS